MTACFHTCVLLVGAKAVCLGCIPRLTLHVEAVLWHVSCPPRFRASFCRHCREQTWSSGGADASPRVALCQWQTRVWGFSGANGDILPFLSGYKIGNLLRPHSVIRLSPLFWDNETKTQKGKGLCQLCLVILGHVHVNQLKTPTGFGPKESWWMHDA